MSSSKKDEREERLLQASRRGELDTVLKLIKSRSEGAQIDINCKGKSKANNGWTPLLLASYFGHKEVAEALIKAGADISVRNGMGNTSLHLASFTGRASVVLLLLQNNASVTDINGEGKTPSQVSNKEEVKQLIVAAEQSMKLDLEKQLLTAVADGNSSELRRLVALPQPPNINCKDTIGNTPLHCAAYRGHKEIAVMLLQHGADTSIKNNSGQTSLQLAKDLKMKKLLDVQPLQVKRELNGPIRQSFRKKSIHKVVTRHEGMLLRRSRFFGWKKYWVVLERGILSYYNKRADAVSGHKRQGFKYLDHAKFSVPKEEKHKIKIEYSDNTQHIFSIGSHEAAPQVLRQRWLNSLREHCAYSTHYTTCPTLLFDESDENFVPVGNVQDSFKDAKAHQQALERQVAMATSLISSFSEITANKSQSKASMNMIQIKTKLDDIVTSSKDMCNVLSHCLDLLIQQEEVRKLHMEEEVEKRRVLEDALHVLATEHHALECSIGMNERIHHTSKLSLLSDNDEFFDAVSDLALASCPDDFKSDSDDDDGDIYIPIEPNAEPNLVEPSIIVNEPTVTLPKSSSSENTNSNSCDNILIRSSSDNTLTPSKRTSEVKAEIIQKSKSETKVGSATSENDSSSSDRVLASQSNRRRAKLPSTMLSRNEFSVWTVLKHCIGKDLSRITMPVIFNEPLTFLQRIAEYMEYVNLLKTAAQCDDPIQRLQYISAFAVSATSSNLERVGKPFNPLLGETYELVRDDFKLVAEQVSHHPPISALQCTGEDFVFHVTVQPKLKFWGKGVEVQPKGMVTLKFPKLNEVYTWNNVNSCVHNIIVGQLWIEQYGQIEVSSLCNGARAVINFKPAGWFGKELNKVEGTIFPSSEKRKKFVIKGDWTDRLICFLTETAMARKGSKRGKHFKVDQEEPSSLTADSLSTSSSDCSLELNNPVLLWKCNTRPPYSKEMYNFTNYALQLNELLPGEEKQLPPTDSRLRPDCRALENGDLELATEEKIRLEEKQRSSRRDRQKKNNEWKPLWFKEEINPYTGQNDWLFTGKYWNRDFSCCPDIF